MSTLKTRFSIGKQNISLDDRDLSNPTPAESAFLKALTESQDFSDTKYRVDTDPMLTEKGKNAKLNPLKDGVWRTILRSVEVVENERLALVKREKELFAVPPISTPFEIAMDRERRDWFRGLSVEQVAKFFQSLQAGESHAEIINSLMRSPVPLMLDMNLKFIEEIHQQNRMNMYPETWAQIEYGNASIKWAELGMAHVIGITLGTTVRSTGDVLAFALANGFDLAAKTMNGEQAVEHARFMAKAKSTAELVPQLVA